LDNTLTVSENIWLNAICYVLSVVCFGVALFFVIDPTLSPENETAANLIFSAVALMSGISGYRIWLWLDLKTALIAGLWATTA
jgi:hypothetical protein